jgi:hypothetical protein
MMHGIADASKVTVCGRVADAAWRSRFVECLEKHTPANPLIEEALAIKQRHLPKQIYKYRRICQNHLGNLETNAIWLSSPEEML